MLNIAFNILAGGRCLEDLELLRKDEGYLNALGAQRIPDPTTAGDFCRRFSGHDVEILMDVINESRLTVWWQQPRDFFDEAIIDANGTLAPTLGECKDGADFAYDGTYGYHPLVISLANTQEPLFLVNRSGNRPSHEGAAARLDQAIALCRKAGFRRITMRGDTDYSQTRHLDRWDADGVGFVFAIQRMQPLYEKTAELPESAWRRLRRPPKHEVQTERRTRPDNVKDEVLRRRGVMKQRTNAELVASFAHQPTACAKPYRIVVLRKNLTIARGEEALLDDMMFFYFITNDLKSTPAEIVLRANGRCNQENLNAQLKSGVAALEMPVGDLVSNWAYMVMASLAWTLKAWMALLLPARGRWRERHRAERDRVLRMEFRSFLRPPCSCPHRSCALVDASCIDFSGGTRGSTCFCAPRTRSASRCAAELTADGVPRTPRSKKPDEEHEVGVSEGQHDVGDRWANWTAGGALRPPVASRRRQASLKSRRLFWV